MILHGIVFHRLEKFLCAERVLRPHLPFLPEGTGLRRQSNDVLLEFVYFVLSFSLRIQMHSV